jgi:hypothetical protein
VINRRFKDPASTNDLEEHLKKFLQKEGGRTFFLDNCQSYQKSGGQFEVGRGRRRLVGENQAKICYASLDALFENPIGAKNDPKTAILGG